MIYDFYAFSAGPVPRRTSLTKNLKHDKYSILLCRPTLKNMFHVGINFIEFVSLYSIQLFKLFLKKEYWILLILYDNKIVHHSFIFPKYFRFPFMAKNDLQIGNTWTEPQHRCKGLAGIAIREIVTSLSKPGRIFWYVAPSDNLPSIRVAQKSGFIKVGEGSRKSRMGINFLGYYKLFQQEPKTKNKPQLRDGLRAGGAVAIWEEAVMNGMPLWHELVPPGSRVLEVGYGDGLLTLYLSHKLGWQVTGLEVDQKAQQRAARSAKQFHLEDRVEFLHGTPEENMRHVGPYDAVFIKTVLLYSLNLEEYAFWLDWILSVLRPGGVLINLETGRSNDITQYYRKLRRRGYTDRCLYTKEVETLYDSRFKIIDRRYYGGWSQFLAPFPALYYIVARIEEALGSRNADNSFIVTIIAQRPD